MLHRPRHPLGRTLRGIEPQPADLVQRDSGRNRDVE
jgi:hypothetical protein